MEGADVVTPDQLHIRKNTQKSKFLLSQTTPTMVIGEGGFALQCILLLDHAVTTYKLPKHPKRQQFTNESKYFASKLVRLNLKEILDSIDSNIIIKFSTFISSLNKEGKLFES